MRIVFAFGNQWTTAMTPQDPDPTIPVSSTWFNPNNNQFTPGPNFTYNGVGELTKLFGWNYTYSSEGQMLTASNGIARSYVYDGQNQRVKLIEPAGTTYFIYGADGAVLAEYSTAPLTGPGGRQYLTNDWLGSTRLTTDSTGNVTTRRDYLPKGK